MCPCSATGDDCPARPLDPTVPRHTAPSARSAVRAVDCPVTTTGPVLCTLLAAVPGVQRRPPDSGRSGSGHRTPGRAVAPASVQSAEPVAHPTPPPRSPSACPPPQGDPAATGGVCAVRRAAPAPSRNAGRGAAPRRSARTCVDSVAERRRMAGGPPRGGRRRGAVAEDRRIVRRAGSAPGHRGRNASPSSTRSWVTLPGPHRCAPPP
jgi:hypothetical protein